MSREKIRAIFDSMDKLVGSDVKNALFYILKRYREQPTKKKFKYVVMNLPIGLIINNTAMDKMIAINDKPLTYKELLDLLLNKEELINLIKGG